MTFLFQCIRELCCTYPYVYMLASFGRCMDAYHDEITSGLYNKNDHGNNNNGEDNIQQRFSYTSYVSAMFQSVQISFVSSSPNCGLIEDFDHVLESVRTLETLRTHHPAIYAMYLAIMRELCPTTRNIRDKIRTELRVLMDVYASLTSVRYVLVDFEKAIPAPSPKLAHSLDQTLRFFAQRTNAIANIPSILQDHVLSLMTLSSVPQNRNLILNILQHCFQDIYTLETILHAPCPGFTQISYQSAMNWLRTLYDDMYTQIQDPSTWETVVSDSDGNPQLQIHPLLPHPEDFLYSEKPWKNALRKHSPKFKQRILYASPPLPINRFMTKQLLALLSRL